MTLPWAESEKDSVALAIAAERLKREGDPFEPSAELHAFLSRASPAAATPDARARLDLATLRALDRAAEAIGFRRRRDAAVLAWVAANERDLVWNEPAGRWIVAADRFWELHERCASLPIADEVAWAGARAQLPGECEGDLPCSVGWLARTDARYLALHPRGARSGTALSNVAVFLDGAVEDPRGAGALSGAPAEDLARLKRDLAALNEALAPLADPRARAARSAADTLLARAAAAAGSRP
jgi:hypothetical protein